VRASVPSETRFRIRMGFEFSVTTAVSGYLAEAYPINPGLFNSANWMRFANLFSMWRMTGARFNYKPAQVLASGAATVCLPSAGAVQVYGAGLVPNVPGSISAIMEMPSGKMVDSNVLGTENHKSWTYRLNTTLATGEMWNPANATSEVLQTVYWIALLNNQAPAGATTVGTVFGTIDMEFRGILNTT